MKKVIIIILVLCNLILLYGCQNNNKIQTSNIPQATTSSVEIEPYNQYFLVGEKSFLTYQASMFFDSFGDIPIPECEVNINFIQIAELKQGILYQLKMDSVPKLEMPKERLSVGYFYVQNDKIIRLWDSDDNVWSLSPESIEKLTLHDKLPAKSKIVCQEEEYKDSLSSGEIGWHEYLIVNGNRREFHSYYQHKQHSGYWESFTWEKDIGLIFYQSGYRDGVDYIKLSLSSVNDADMRKDE